MLNYFSSSFEGSTKMIKKQKLLLAKALRLSS